jgi:signal peptidase II
VSDDNANDDHPTDAHPVSDEAGEDPEERGSLSTVGDDDVDSLDTDSLDTDSPDTDSPDEVAEQFRWGAASRLWPGLVVVTSLVVLVADQLTKRWAQNSFQRRSRHVFWELDFVYTENTGASFSLGESLGPVIAVLVVVIAGVLFWVSRSAQRTGVLVAIGMVLGGSIGNFADRLFRAEEGLFTGGVIDFIKFTDSYPVFNVADMGIVCGGIAIVALGGFTAGPARA